MRIHKDEKKTKNEDIANVSPNGMFEVAYETYDSVNDESFQAFCHSWHNRDFTTKIKLPHNVKLREYQIPVWREFFSDTDNKPTHYILQWHRRAGKDLLAFNMLIKKAWQEPGLYFYLFPQKNQGEKAVLEGYTNEGKSFMEFVPPAMLESKNKAKMTLTLKNGSKIIFETSSKYEYVRGSNPRGIVISEFQITDPACLQALIPMLIANKGWSILLFTVAGRNHAWRIMENAMENPSYYVSRLDVTQTLENGKRVISDEDIKAATVYLSDTQIKQEFYNDPDAHVDGVFFGQELKELREKGRLSDRIQIDKSAPVHTLWDLGISDDMAVWFFQIQDRDNIIFINCISRTNTSLHAFIDMLHKYREKHNIVYGRHYAPFDIAVRELSDGVSRMKKAEAMGIKFYKCSKVKEKMLKLGQVRSMMYRFKFKMPECQYGIDCLDNYQRVKNEKTGVWSTEGQVDWTRHLIDAMMLIHDAFVDNFRMHPAISSSFRIKNYAVHGGDQYDESRL